MPTAFRGSAAVPSHKSLPAIWKMILPKLTSISLLAKAATLLDNFDAAAASEEPTSPPASLAFATTATATSTTSSSFAFASSPSGPVSSPAEAMDIVLRCVDVASGGVLKDGCECASVLYACTSAPPDIDGLLEFCASAEACCGDDPITNEDYNACFEARGTPFPPIPGFDAGAPDFGPPTFGPVPEDCADALIQSLTLGIDVPFDESACCADNPDHPYCVLLTCADPRTETHHRECDCAILYDVYSHPSFSGPHLDISSAFLDACCAPGETTLEEATACLDGTTGPAANPPALCAADPAADACACLSADGVLDEGCDCGAMLDLYAEDPLWGLSWGVTNVTELENCCVRGERTVGETSTCIFEGYDCGLLFQENLWDDDQSSEGEDFLGFGDIEGCCTPGRDTVGEATECLFGGLFGGNGSLFGDDWFFGGNGSFFNGSLFGDDDWFHGGNESFHDDWYFGEGSALDNGTLYGHDDWFFGNDDSLKCWFSIPAQGPPYSTSTGFIGDGTQETFCASYCYDCGASDPDDGICTEDMVAAGERASVRVAISEDILDLYEDVYADSGFTSCQDDYCNSVDACTGEDDLGIPETSGPASCWNDDPSSGIGYSLDLGGFGDGAVCISYCEPCSFLGPGDCTDEQLASGYRPVHSYTYTDFLQFYEGYPGFMSCDTDDCNTMDTCDNVTQAGLDGCVDQINQGLIGVGGGAADLAFLDFDSCCAANPDTPYCMYHNCVDGSCDCSVLANLYGNESSPLYLPLYAEVIDTCCIRGETTLFEAEECLLQSSPDFGPQSICDEDPEAPACLCMNESGELDETCDCSVMLNLYSDPNGGLGLAGLFGEILNIESCCTPGQMTVADANECIAESFLGGLLGGLFGSYMPTYAPASYMPTYAPASYMPTNVPAEDPISGGEPIPSRAPASLTSEDALADEGDLPEIVTVAPSASPTKSPIGGGQDALPGNLTDSGAPSRAPVVESVPESTTPSNNASDANLSGESDTDILSSSGVAGRANIAIIAFVCLVVMF